MANLSAQRVRSKTRTAVRRREDAIEQEEIEGGEINLIPYLDIVTNLMLFLLFSISAGIVFTQIDTTLPDKAPAATTAQAPNQDPSEQQLKLVVSITRDRMMLWSISGLEGTLASPKATFPRIGRDGEQCDGGYMCESNNCVLQRCAASKTGELPMPVFDYRGLNKHLFDIAAARYPGKPRKADTYQIILMADGSTPYQTIASTMSAMRCKMPDFGVLLKEGCALPTEDPELKKAKEPWSEDKRLYDTSRAVYDPNKMALFSDILFSSGFE